MSLKVELIVLFHQKQPVTLSGMMTVSNLKLHAIVLLVLYFFIPIVIHREPYYQLHELLLKDMRRSICNVYELNSKHQMILLFVRWRRPETWNGRGGSEVREVVKLLRRVTKCSRCDDSL